MSRARSFVWRKLSAAKWEDVWLDRLSEYRDRLAIHALAGARSIRLEAYQLTGAQAARLRKHFGGVTAPMTRLRALQAAPPRAAIKVRDKLLVVATAHECAAASLGARKVLLIPAGMAFGTGDHATTATCLRLLADVSDTLAGQPWEMLDLGCGSGILALAARLLGARRVLAGDYDPDAVRTARENARTNAIDRIAVQQLDVHRWRPARTWEVVAANMYSGLLIAAAPIFAAATTPGGRLIFSGILREQEDEVVATLRAAQFRIDRLVQKGKWVTGLATRRRRGARASRPLVAASRRDELPEPRDSARAPHPQNLPAGLRGAEFLPGLDVAGSSSPRDAATSGRDARAPRASRPPDRAIRQ